MTSTDQKEVVLKLIENRTDNLSRLRAAYGSVDVDAMTEAIKSLDKVLIAWASVKHVPLQLCPICDGGQRFFPAGKSCSLCNGRKVVPHEIIEPKQ